MYKRISFILFLIFISIMIYGADNEINKKILTKKDIRAIWSKIEITKITAMYD